jgi:hypothetical protein
VIPVVQEDDGGVPPPLPEGYAEQVIAGVIQNLLRDAHGVTNAVMYAVVDEFGGHGLELSSDQSDRLRKAVFDMVVGALRTRLLVGLYDECGVPDDMRDLGLGGEHLVEGMPSSHDGLMRQFRETLASEECE